MSAGKPRKSLLWRLLVLVGIPVVAGAVLCWWLDVSPAPMTYFWAGLYLLLSAIAVVLDPDKKVATEPDDETAEIPAYAVEAVRSAPSAPAAPEPRARGAKPKANRVVIVGVIGAAAGFVASVAGNLVASSLDADKAAQFPVAARFFQNHDIGGLAGRAVKVTLEWAADAQTRPEDGPRRDELLRLADAAYDSWQSRLYPKSADQEELRRLRRDIGVLTAGADGSKPSAERDATVARLRHQVSQIEERSTPIPLERSLEQALIGAIVADDEREIDVAAWLRFLQRAAEDGRLEIRYETLTLAANELHDRLPKALREALKIDAAANGKAYPAMQLALLGEIVESVAAGGGRSGQAVMNSEALSAKLSATTSELLARLDASDRALPAARIESALAEMKSALAARPADPPPRLLIRVADGAWRRDVTDVVAVDANARIEFRPDRADGRTHYILGIDERGQAAIHAPDAFAKFAVDGWWPWDVGPGPAETVLLLSCAKELTPEARRSITGGIGALGHPPGLEEGVQIAWAFRSATMRTTGRGAPAATPGPVLWSDRVCATLSAVEGLEFEGRTIAVRPARK